jgi:hypothetical protein
VFDFRYHVASLIAVFIALVIGILVGIGLSGRGFVSDAERKNLENTIDELRSDRDAARGQLAAVQRRQSATDHYADDTYAALVRGRLRGMRIAVVYAGSVDGSVEGAVADAIRSAGGRVVRVRALRIPLDVRALERAIVRHKTLESYAGADQLRALGRDVGSELAAGGRTPLLDALADVLLEEREGSGQPAADAVVVRRSAAPQQGATHDFLTGLYGGLAGSGIPAVGVEPSDSVRSAVPAFARSGLSTVDGVDTAAGKLALVLELAGAAPGHYGVADTASDGLLPPVVPVTASS